jgi:hypothetical protein
MFHLIGNVPDNVFLGVLSKLKPVRNFNGDLAVHSAIQSGRFEVAKEILVHMKANKKTKPEDYLGFRGRTRIVLF